MVDLFPQWGTLGLGEKERERKKNPQWNHCGIPVPPFISDFLLSMPPCRPLFCSMSSECDVTCNLYPRLETLWKGINLDRLSGWVNAARGSESGQVCQRLGPSHYPLRFGGIVWQISASSQVGGRSLNFGGPLDRLDSQTGHSLFVLFAPHHPGLFLTRTKETMCVCHPRLRANNRIEYMASSEKSNMVLSPESQLWNSCNLKWLVHIREEKLATSQIVCEYKWKRV